MISTIITMQISNNKKIPSSMKKPPSTTNNLEVSKQTAASNPPSERKRKTKQNKHKIVLVGNSHARDCASKLQGILPNYCEVMSIQVQGHRLNKSSREGNNELTKEDMLIFRRGTNDIIWNNSRRGIKKTHKSVTDN
jgi:hypothetical protein